jgi:NADH-quinone oxidoreductase subunit I/electron transport complex protein RnfC
MTTDIQRGNIITVDRGAGKRRVGQGLLKGMAVIWQHFQGSFRKNERFSDIHGTFTVEYPDERVRLPEAYRNMPILLYDEATGHELCTSCYQCQRICPPQVIHMTQAKDPDTGKAVPAVAEFVIEYDACMSCGFCAEVCPFDAIKMDHDYELATDMHGGLTVHKEQLNRPISYYAGIAPNAWKEVEAGAMKKLQGNIKRRPDVIGIAPHLVEKIAARRRELVAAQAAAAAAQPAAEASVSAAQPAAASGASTRLSPEEKAAKLAAIRAQKAAAAAPAAGASAPEPQPTPEGSPSGLAGTPAPADEKAARLAAIRAKNAAKVAPAEGTAAGATGGGAPVDEKAARLAAIRAKNAAKQAESSDS